MNTSVRLLPSEPLHVVVDAHSARVMRPSAMTEPRLDVIRMKLSVSRMPVNDLKVRPAVVGAVVIDVMNDFIRPQGSTDGHRHDEPMLEHVALSIGHNPHRVIARNPDADIPVTVRCPSALPSRALRPRVFAGEERSPALHVAENVLEHRRPLTLKHRSTVIARNLDPDTLLRSSIATARRAEAAGAVPRLPHKRAAARLAEAFDERNGFRHSFILPIGRQSGVVFLL